MLIVAVDRSYSLDNAICYVLYGSVDDVTFSNNGLHSARRWQHHCGRRAAASSHKFATYSSGGATLFASVVVYNGSHLRTEAKSAIYDCLVRFSFSLSTFSPRFRNSL